MARDPISGRKVVEQPKAPKKAEPSGFEVYEAKQEKKSRPPPKSTARPPWESRNPFVLLYRKIRSWGGKKKRPNDPFDK
jgi:hypothetical protein